MPLQRRLPKFGFTSRKGRVTAEVRLHEIAKVSGDVVTVQTLQAADIIPQRIRFVKVIAAGELARALTVQGIAVTAGALKAIEAAGGKVEA
jgi:large subunit ribosomal protein L15